MFNVTEEVGLSLHRREALLHLVMSVGLLFVPHRRMIRHKDGLS